jgi:iron(II)-dependent oxidoreductase
MRSLKNLLTVLLLVLSAVVGSAQQGPLSLAQIEKLLAGGVGQERITGAVSERGIDFEATANARARLRKAGTGAALMQALEKASAAYVVTRPGAPATKTAPDPALSKLEEENRKLRDVLKKAEEDKKKPPEAKVVTAPPPPAPPPPQRSNDGAQMVSVPAGEFWMGSEESDAFASEKPRRRVSLDAFRIDKYEVTNALYRRFMDATGHRAPEYWNNGKWNESNQPVVGVDWNDANAYCNWAGKRLPTEAEWEKAARGTDGRLYPWGEQWDVSRANSNESKLGKTVAVGSYPGGVSSYGAHDMAGNVWEWVADWYDANYYSNAPDRNPKGPVSGQSRVLHGGSWGLNPRYLRSSARLSVDPSNRDFYIGFRCSQ